MAALSVTVLAGASWLTGTMPGVASPFTHHPGHGHAGVHSPAEPGAASGGSSAVPYLSGSVAPGQAKPHHQGNGHHTGQTKPHTNNGHHTGQTKPHDNSGNHSGQIKPHDNGGGQGNGHQT